MSTSLAVSDLRFKYRKRGPELFDGLHHVFASNQLTAVTGESGRGKSTLLYLLGLLLKPSSGAVLFDGAAVSSAPDDRRSQLRAHRIGFVFQDSALDPSRRLIESILEPALYAGVPRSQARERARTLMDTMQLTLRLDHRPGEISGGQAQRAAVCRALMNNPDVLLADEPTGNLDRTNAGIVLDALRETTSGGRAVIIASHDPFVLDRADCILRL